MKTGIRYGQIQAVRNQFLRNLENVGPSRHPRLVSDSDENATMAVLIPFITINGKPSVLLTKRSIHLRSHRGEVCFPGGRMENGETTKETALRETFEEIGLEPDNVEIWGNLKSVVRRQQDFVVTPIVGHVKDAEKALNNLNVEEGEVQAVFSVSIEELYKNANFTKFRSPKLKYVLPSYDSENFEVHYNQKNEYLHKVQRIWGLSALMLHQALMVLDPDGYKLDQDIKFY